MSQRTANSNITPGGHVMVGPSEDHAAWVSIDNEYTYDEQATDRSTIRNVENRLRVALSAVENGMPVADIGRKVIDVPITQAECYELAWMFLTVAQNRRHWEGIS